MSQDAEYMHIKQGCVEMLNSENQWVQLGFTHQYISPILGC